MPFANRHRNFPNNPRTCAFSDDIYTLQKAPFSINWKQFCLLNISKDSYYSRREGNHWTGPSLQTFLRIVLFEDPLGNQQLCSFIHYHCISAAYEGLWPNFTELPAALMKNNNNGKKKKISEELGHFEVLHF